MGNSKPVGVAYKDPDLTTGTAATTYYITFIGPGGRLIVSPALLTKA